MKTNISIQGTDFYINGELTYKDRFSRGTPHRGTFAQLADGAGYF